MVQFVLFLFIQITPADVQSGIEQGFLIHQFVFPVVCWNHVTELVRFTDRYSFKVTNLVLLINFHLGTLSSQKVKRIHAC